ncbi:MAG: hypothetical protein SPF89_10900 [Sphaerochaetaceae bacterium]|nr:hypothetical protein [Spirochaetales bacterium]MDY5500603.1 hypothetical protein [Sphaerochaetaceae bacterium]
MRKLGKLLLLLLVLVLAADAIWQVTHPVSLQGFFTNDDYNLFPAETIEKEYSSLIHKRVNFEDSLYIISGSSDPLVTASTSKIMAYIAAKELDFVVSTKEVLEHYETGLSMEDLQILVPELSPYFVYRTQSDGTQKAVALEMSQSRFVQGRHPEKPYYLFIPRNSIRTEASRDFIRWAFQER